MLTKLHLDTAFTRPGRENDICVILNVGLRNAADTRDISVNEAIYRLRKADVGFLEAVVLQSDTERTLVVRGVTDCSLFGVRDAAVDLEQDCIAVWNIDDQCGTLEGPNADAWGRFDASRFFCLDGERLVGHLEAEG